MTRSGVGYDPVIEGQRYNFGVSGKLFRDNVLMYDRETDSLWSQILRRAVTGPLTGARLEPFPLVETVWKEWKKQHPNTLVLSNETGHIRSYHQDPYEQNILSPNFQGKRYELGLAVIVAAEAKVYPFKQLKKVKRFPITDRVGTETVLIHFDKKSKTAWATNQEGGPVESFLTDLKAWRNFYSTKVFEAP